ncbi:MAG: FHA domain-containing protein [Labilithrix sp.]|nr:FHA domain-containing protein [Labilithrix sp.]
MTCSTCGRENPAHLTFCQECGQRLGPRIAPPTPPIGLGAQDNYGPAPAAHAAPPRAAMANDHTPAAPAVAPVGATAERRCKVCDTANGPNLRYCTSCGSTLDPAGAARPPAAPTAIPSPANAIVPMGVVGLASNPAAEATRTCGRCKGTADASAQFCKFCGNALGEPAAPTPERVEPPHANGSGDAPRGARGPTSPIAQVAPQVLAAMRPVPVQAAPTPSPSPIGPAAPAPAPVERASAYGAAPAPAPVGRASPYGTPAPVERASAPGAAPAPAPVERASAYGAAPQASGAAALAAIQPQRDAARLASPATAPARGRLVVIAKSGADGPSYPFGDLVDIGRTEGSVVVAEDPYLSPRHVRIVWTNGKLLLRDLGSTNGVYLRLAASRDTSPRRGAEGPEIAVPLVDQDLILVGQQVLRFDILKEAEGGFGPAQEHGTLLFGSPAAPRYARLCQRTVEGIARDIYYIRKVETVLGRESGDVVFTEDPFLSRRHAAIRLLSRDGSPSGGSRPPPPGEAHFALVDLGSSNGTFLRIRSDVELAPGDHFRVGQQLFRVDFDGVHG